MSSRNTYLTPEQRVSALSLYQSLINAQVLLESGIKDAAEIVGSATDLIRSHPDTEIDYIAVCDPETLVDVKTIDRPVRMALAVKVGKARLIDNMLLRP
jgi:pantoate--beta-alanine ligase